MAVTQVSSGCMRPGVGRRVVEMVGRSDGGGKGWWWWEGVGGKEW